MPNAPAPAIKLVLTDIDGTILPYGHDVVPARTRAAFHACLDAGIRVGPASGRAVSHVAPAFANDVACTATALAINGMHVYLDGELIVEKLVKYAEVGRSSKTITVGGEKIPCTVISLSIDQDALALAVTDVVEYAMEDKDLEKLVNRIAANGSFCGATRRDRTGHLHVTNVLLCQMS